MNNERSQLNCEYIWKGLIPYPESLELQLNLWRESLTHSQQKRARGVVIGLEHPTVITLGKRGDPSLDLNLVDDDSTPVVTIDRGGQATLHSPGQLVIYPILPLGLLDIPILKFVSCLHSSTQKTLQRFHVETQCPENLGLFSSKGKIAFTGMRIESGVSRHGIAINISNDLSLFSKIRACGVSNAYLDSLGKHLGDPPSCADFFSLWQKDFATELQKLL